jgi:hypothetical protein
MRAGKRLGDVEAKARAAETQAVRAEGLLERMRSRAERDIAKAEASVEAAPARLRPTLQRNRQVARLLTEQENTLRKEGLNEAAAAVGQAADELPATLAALKDQGLDFDHFVHLKLDARPTSAGVRQGLLPAIRKGRAEKRRTGSAAYDRTVRAQAQAEIDEARIGIARQSARKIAAMPMARKFASVDEARAAGYVAWDAANPFEVSSQITRTTTFVPEHIVTNFRRYFNDPKWDQLLTQTYDPLQKAFKVTVLPLSPSWQVGNVFGNALLATIGGGLDPVTLAVNVTRAVRSYRRSGPRGQRSFEGVGPRRLYTSGPTHAEFEFLEGSAPPAQTLLGRGAQKATAPLSGLVRKSYRLNSFVDDVGRSAVYLAKKSGGASDQAALRSALQAMGDFSRMTPFEKRVVRRIIPFYAWQRHLTQLAFRLPIEHPLRTAWTLHLADVYGEAPEDLQDLPEYLRGAVPFGDQLLGTGALNPFQTVGGPILEPEALPRSLSPIIKAGLANLPGSPGRGIDTFTGEPFTRPPGSGRHNQFGQPLPTAPSLLHQLGEISPQKRLLDAVRGRDQIARYSTGDPVLRGGRPIETPEKDALNALLRAVGFPLVSREKALEMIDRITETQRREQRSAERYRRNLSRIRG